MSGTEARESGTRKLVDILWFSNFQNLFQKACLPAHMGRDAATCQRMRCCYDEGIRSKYSETNFKLKFSS